MDLVNLYVGIKEGKDQGHRNKEAMPEPGDGPGHPSLHIRLVDQRIGTGQAE